MSIKLTSGNVLLGPSGNPSEDSACCCAEAGCDDCSWQIQNADFSAIDISGADPSSDPEWNGSYCEISPIFLQSNFVLPSSLSVNGAVLYVAYLERTSPGNWRLTISLKVGGSGIGYWIGTLVNATANGTYNRTGGNSATPASFTIGACS